MSVFEVPKRPGKVLTIAFLRAMSGLVALARDRATGKAKPLYYGDSKIKGIAVMWKDAKERYKATANDQKPDATVMTNQENNIRRNYTRILLKTSVRYGNTETKRVKRKEGNQNYLNILWDYAGSRLRDLGMIRYPFPKAPLIEYDNGKPVYGYRGSKKNPKYIPIHYDKSELDFVDMIRAHLMELARQCLKYGVPIRDSKSYIDELIWRLTPFLDYVYTEGKIGRAGFIKGSMKDLREVVNRISVLYGQRNGRAQSITSEVREVLSGQSDEEILDNSIIDPDHLDEFMDEQDYKADPIEEELFDLLLKRCMNEGNPEWKKNIRRIHHLKNSDILTVDDAKNLLEEFAEKSRKIGSEFHAFVSHLFPSPFKLSAAIYHGDSMVSDKSGYLLVSEIPIAKGRGRPDLILLRRKDLKRPDESKPRAIYVPCMIVDVKTRSAFDLDLYGVESKAKPPKNIVIESYWDRRKLTDDEWIHVLQCIPKDDEKLQVEAYSREILSEYRNVTWIDNSPPDEMVKAIIVIDSKENWVKMRDALYPLIVDTYNKLQTGSIKENDIQIPNYHMKPLRMALKLLSTTGNNIKPVQIDEFQSFNPFEYRRDDFKEFILYLAVSGRGSQAQSAASIAGMWHGLRYLHSLAKHKHRDVVWFDLTGEYSFPTLMKSRLRLGYHEHSLRRFVKKRVQVKDYSLIIQNYLYNGKGIQEFRHNLLQDLAGKRRPILFVTGWDTLRRATSKHLISTLNELIMCFLNNISQKSTVIWLTRPVPLSQTNSMYETRCVAPFYSGKYWRYYVNRIIWNLPMPPPRLRANAPSNDHYRIIVTEQLGKDAIEPEIVSIDLLRNWGEKFRGRRSTRQKPVVYHKSTGYTSEDYTAIDYTFEIEKGLSLIPHLNSSLFENLDNLLSGLNIESCSIPSKQVDEWSKYMIRLMLHQTCVSTNKDRKDKRVKRLLGIKRVKKKREYREMYLGVEEVKRTVRPPSEQLMSIGNSKLSSLVQHEITSLRQIVNFLQKNAPKSNEWKNLLKELEKRINGSTRRVTNANVDKFLIRLQMIRETLETDELSRDIWRMLVNFRTRIFATIESDAKEYIESLREKHPDILLITGNHLFLLLLIAINGINLKSYTIQIIEELWRYLQSWHISGLGLAINYPQSHTTGVSVFDRAGILKSLKQRAVSFCDLLDKEKHVSEVRFGQLIPFVTKDSAGMWLIFQSRPGVHEMNAFLITMDHIDTGRPISATLKSMIRDRPYWNEADISSLGRYANLPKKSLRVPVLICNQRKITGFWIFEEEKKRWVPIGGLEYSTRRFEEITLIRTLTLRKEKSMEPICMDEIRKLPAALEDNVSIALLVIAKGFDGCTPVRCGVSLNSDEMMYTLSFYEQGKMMTTDVGEPLQLLIKRTSDLLEVLRRPDNECEPVIVEDMKLTWNRFKDIQYDDDTRILRPWVERRKPFKGLKFGYPQDADRLYSATRGAPLELELFHDESVCPLRFTPIEEIREERKKGNLDREAYVKKLAGPAGQPDSISEVVRKNHGSCWRLRVKSQGKIPSEVAELMNIRMKDALATSLLRAGEISYFSKTKSSWIAHKFGIVIPDPIPPEFLESWHVKMLLEYMLKQGKGMLIPGSYRDKQQIWNPMISITSDYVKVLFRLEIAGEDRSHSFQERSLVFRPEKEVREFLEQAMKQLLEKYAMKADKKLHQLIKEEIDDAIEIFDITKEGIRPELKQLKREEDAAGGESIYAVFARDDETSEEHVYCVSPWLHEISEVEVDVVKQFVSDGIAGLEPSEREIEIVTDKVAHYLIELGKIVTDGGEIVKYKEKQMEEEEELRWVVKDWEKSLDKEPYNKKFLGNALVELAQFLFNQDRIKEALPFVSRAINLYEESPFSEDLNSILAKALILKAEVLLECIPKAGTQESDMIQEEMTMILQRAIEIAKTPNSWGRLMSEYKVIVDRAKLLLEKLNF